MTRSKQKEEEIEICKIFLSAYGLNIHHLTYIPSLNEVQDKFDVSIKLNEKEPELKFQVKRIEFHSNDKTQIQYNDEIGWRRAYKKGNKNPRMHVYNYPGSSWQNALQSTVKTLFNNNLYSPNEREHMDLLFLINDSSLPSDSTFVFSNPGQYGFRSISYIHYGRKESLVVYANSDAPRLLKKNQGIKRQCVWIP